MSGISFFTPIRDGVVPTSCDRELPKGVNCHVAMIKAPEVRTSWDLTAFKVVAYLTLTSILLLVVKAVLRSNYLFPTCPAARPIPEPVPMPPGPVQGLWHDYGPAPKAL